MIRDMMDTWNKFNALPKSWKIVFHILMSPIYIVIIGAFGVIVFDTILGMYRMLGKHVTNAILFGGVGYVMWLYMKKEKETNDE